jgi:hypothetical protein
MDHLQRHGLALDGIAQSAQEAAGLDLALDEIVLRAFLQCLPRQGFIVEPGQHDQRDAGRDEMRTPYSAQSMRIRQAEIEQDHVDRMGGKMRLGLAHALDMRQSDGVCALLLEYLAQQAGIAEIVFVR